MILTITVLVFPLPIMANAHAMSELVCHDQSASIQVCGPHDPPHPIFMSKLVLFEHDRTWPILRFSLKDWILSRGEFFYLSAHSSPVRHPDGFTESFDDSQKIFRIWWFACMYLYNLSPVKRTAWSQCISCFTKIAKVANKWQTVYFGFTFEAIHCNLLRVLATCVV